MCPQWRPWEFAIPSEHRHIKIHPAAFPALFHAHAQAQKYVLSNAYNYLSFWKQVVG